MPLAVVAALTAFFHDNPVKTESTYAFDVADPDVDGDAGKPKTSPPPENVKLAAELIESPAFNTFDDAAPVNAPVNDVDVTDAKPATVVVVDPSEILVDPSVNELFVKAPFGIPVMLAPDIVGAPVHVGVAPAPADASNWLAVPADAFKTIAEVVDARVI